MSILEQKSFLATIPPFDKLSAADIEKVSLQMDIAYYPKGRVLISAAAPAQFLYIVIKGMVLEKHPQEEITVSVYGPQDSFDALSILSGPSENTFITQEETICYLLEKEVFRLLCRQNPACQNFYYQNLSARLNTLNEQRSKKALASFMVTKIGQAYMRKPIYVEAEKSIFDAVKVMKENRITSILVKRGDEIGIASDTDIRQHVVLERMPVDAPIGAIAHYKLIGLNTHEFLFNAKLMMTKHAIKRLVIWDDSGEIVGILDMLDLVSFFADHSQLAAEQVERASSIEELRAASTRLVSVISALDEKGVKIRYIAQMVTEINRKLFAKLYQFLAPPELVENSCLICMGSEGREEQAMRTDQDNAIIVRDGFECPQLSEIAAKFTETLISFGYPSCPGNIMVSNPFWRKSLQEFKNSIYHWIETPNSENLMNLAIFYDSSAVAGDGHLLEQAQQALFDSLQDNTGFFIHFAKPILAFETPLSFFENFILEKTAHKEQMDIKKGGIFPIVHGIRSLALEHRLLLTNTIARIKALQERGVFDKDGAVELIEALGFMNWLRMHSELKQYEAGEPYDNYIMPGELNKMERDLLKDSLKVVNQFKKRMTYHFKLNMVM